MFSFNEYLFFAAAYLIGSIPFGIIVARVAGLGDLTTQGSGNIGATNVVRVGGKKLGIITFLLDFLKSYVPITIYIQQFGPKEGALICALIIVIGHIFPIFNKFKGGKGVATGLGALMAISPIVCLFAMILWLICFILTKISSVSALFAFTLMPFAFLFISNNNEIMIFAIALSLIIFSTHLTNIKRLMNGKENGFK